MSIRRLAFHVRKHILMQNIKVTLRTMRIQFKQNILDAYLEKLCPWKCKTLVIFNRLQESLREVEISRSLHLLIAQFPDSARQLEKCGQVFVWREVVFPESYQILKNVSENTRGIHEQSNCEYNRSREFWGHIALSHGSFHFGDLALNVGLRLFID
jgi:hypothetical protein